jgi:hypothetical protein
MKRIVGRCSLAVLVATTAIPASASTDGPGANWALNEFGGTPAERQMLHGGEPGVIMATSPASLLFMAWRRLHGQTLPAAAGEALAVPCCGGSTGGSSDAVTGWLAARKTVPGAPPRDPYLDTERPGPDYTSAPNCLDDAFRNATATLQARAQSYGIASPEIRSWVAAQDVVFTACSKPVTGLPPLPDGTPDWLRADYRYQSAALSFYNGDYPAAAAAFAAIGQDAASPWHAIAPYLRVRALLRQALASKAQPDFATAREAAISFAPEAPLHDAAAQLGSMAQLHADPAAAGARLIAALQADRLTAQAAADFKDLQTLAGSTAVPEALDWITTFKTGAAAPPVPVNDHGNALDRAKAADARRVAALGHARDRYGATHDSAWLIAVLALMQPDDEAAGSSMADAAAVDGKAPSFLTLLYHRVRLTAGTADPAGIRTALDPVLARDDLTTTTRNLFLAERLLTVTSLGEFAKYALRRRTCTKESDGCKNQDWGYYGTGPGLFDAEGEVATIGMGDDARYLVDRMALSTRMALSGDTALPAPIRMDIALTSFARAVQVHDDAAADRMAVALQWTLPAMGADFAAIPKAAKGADKLFAQYMILAKIPGLRADLVDYTRPAGNVADFAGAWPNWIVLDRPDPDSIAPAPVLYDNANYQIVDVPAGTDLGEGHRRVPDVVCDGMCGAGGFVPRQPAFLADTAVKATAERRFLPPPGKYGDVGSGPSGRAEAFPSQDPDHSAKTLAPPPGATFVWEFILRYASTHPQDPRVPEALHWLIHVGHYGQSHDHSGKRAFLLLKSRYPNSNWAKQNPFYYD